MRMPATKGELPGPLPRISGRGHRKNIFDGRFRTAGAAVLALTHVTMVAGPDTPSARDVTVLARSSQIVTIGRDITIPPDTGTSDLAGQHLTT